MQIWIYVFSSQNYCHHKQFVLLDNFMLCITCQKDNITMMGMLCTLDNFLGFLISSKAQSLHSTRPDSGPLGAIVTSNVLLQCSSHTDQFIICLCYVCINICFFLTFFFSQEKKCGMDTLIALQDHKFIIIALLWWKWIELNKGKVLHVMC